MENKKNCWEIKKCGREPGGENVSAFGVCPAAMDQKADGIHHGKNGGRCCWAITGTLCGGRIQGRYVTKQISCIQCEFYKLVKQEEGRNFYLVHQIKSKIER